MKEAIGIVVMFVFMTLLVGACVFASDKEAAINEQNRIEFQDSNQDHEWHM